ncbi:unnamed protein product [Prorocentrum cordatum]|uniref:C2H2-type domain-containing protein n=1 Tax=Prorocentrum cordatum TaxID=2364126 RepID=A0ABN9W4F9_9DINO|nr:unnamed protein product [Polarella glacialis]
MPPKRKPAAVAGVTGVQQSVKSSDRAVGVLQRVVEHVREHAGKLPSQTRDDEKKLYFQFKKLRGKRHKEKLGCAHGDEKNVARRFERLRDRAQGDPDSVTAEAHRLLRRIPAEIGPLALVLERQQEAERESADFARRHEVDPPRHLPRIQTQMGEGDSHCGSSPFPFLVNMKNTCYLNSVVTCLVHCAGPRTHLLEMDRASELREALQDLIRNYTSGVAEPAEAKPWHWDVLAPCRLVDATGMGAACFAAHAPGLRGAEMPLRSDDVLTPRERVNTATRLGNLATQSPIDGPAVIQELLSAEDMKLRATPATLAIRLPQSKIMEIQGSGESDDEEILSWIQSEDSDGDSFCPVTWGERGLVDLRACCADGCERRERAVYRLRACVHYCNRGHVPGAGVIDQGHFTASFRAADDRWYDVDDLDREAVVRARECCPDQYPQICFLERVGDPEVSVASLSPHLVHAGDDDDAPPVKRQKLLGKPAAVDTGRVNHDGPPLKRIRLKGKQPPGPCAASSAFRTPKKQRDDERNRKGRKQNRDGRKQDREDLRQNRKGTAIQQLRKIPAEKAGDNSDGKRCDLDNDQAETCPVGAFRTEQEIFREAEKSRRWLGDVFVCLRLLVTRLPEPRLVAGDLLNNLPEVPSYKAHQMTGERLQEALGVVEEEEIRAAEARVQSGTWSLALVATRLDELLLVNDASMNAVAGAGTALATALGHVAVPAAATATMRAHMDAADWPARPRDCGLAGAAAMPPRLRREPRGEAPPCLPRACHLCEASYPTKEALQKHVRRVHGGDQRAREAWLSLESEKPHFVETAGKRRIPMHFAQSYQVSAFAKLDEAPPRSHAHFWCALYRRLASDGHHDVDPRDLDAVAAIERGFIPDIAQATEEDQPPAEEQPAPEPRRYVACAFCAVQYWNDELTQEFIAGPNCFMKNPAKVAHLLSAEWYHEQWDLIPWEQLLASSVDLPHLGPDGETMMTTPVLMHKRRVPEGACAGAKHVYVCHNCKDCYKGPTPRLSPSALSNYLWLGRHEPVFRDASLGHQLLLALGPVVSMKVYLSSKGVDERARQHAQTWTQQFLQQGMQGTAVAFPNGNIADDMQSFPPEEEVLQHTFAAVFTGPERPAEEEQAAIDGDDAEAERRREEMARQRLRKEVELQVCREEFDVQARRLQATNYVYNDDKVKYRTDLKDALPEERAVPSCMLACARFVKVDPGDEDDTQARGPASSTTAGAQENEAAADADAAESTPFLSVLDDDTADAAELSTLPQLLRMLENASAMGGRAVANETFAKVEVGGFEALDEVGRDRLLKACRDIHELCRKVSPEEEHRRLLWRVQQIVSCKSQEDYDMGDEAVHAAGQEEEKSRGEATSAAATAETPTRAETQQQQPPSAAEVAERVASGDAEARVAAGLAAGAGAAPEGQPRRARAQLRVPTGKDPASWWHPSYWSIARPTDFCYGDCAWGHENQPHPLSVVEWITFLLRREELEYTLPGEEKPYVAAKVNRFRCSWQVLHLMHSFWRVTETTKSVHAALKMPGAFGLARKLQELKPEDIQDAMLKMHEKGKKVTLQGLMSDKDVPQMLQIALSSMQRCASGILGSNGHRKLLHREGVAYTLRFGPPLVFLTPNLADTKQPLLLVVQGEEYHFDERITNLNPAYREMVQRLARDPVGKTLVFELMVRLFFIHVLGIRSDVVGWRRGAARKSSGARCFDSFAADFFEDSITGPFAAAFGAIEAQGRGSLHPHVLVWLVLISMQELLSTLMRDRATFKKRVELWMRELVHAVASVQESAVSEYAGFLRGDLAGPLPPYLKVEELPLGPKERGQSGADGERETVPAERLDLDESKGDQELYFWRPDKIEEDEMEQEAWRPKLPLRNEEGNEVDLDTWREEQMEKKKSLWSTKLNEFPSGQVPTFRLGHSAQSAMDEFRQALPSDDWIRAMCKHARDLVIGCAVHVCSPSCFKYHSKGSSQICRHNFYHVVNLHSHESEQTARIRRRGKPLRGCVGIFRDTRYGMAGRIITFQKHPGECSTNYTGLVTIGSNLDVQDLRRVLPPELWMDPSELEPPADTSESAPDWAHGAYPQRFKDISIGKQEHWGWMQHLGTTEHRRHAVVTFENWHEVLKNLGEMPPHEIGRPSGPDEHCDGDEACGEARD